MFHAISVPFERRCEVGDAQDAILQGVQLYPAEACQNRLIHVRHDQENRSRRLREGEGRVHKRSCRLASVKSCLAAIGQTFLGHFGISTCLSVRFLPLAKK